MASVVPHINKVYKVEKYYRVRELKGDTFLSKGIDIGILLIGGIDVTFLGRSVVRIFLITLL